MGDEGGSGGEGLGDGGDNAIEKSGAPTPSPLDNRKDDDISLGGQVDVSPTSVMMRYRFIAKGLWAAGITAFAILIAIQLLPASQERTQIGWLLGVAIGGLFATAVMHGRLADNRQETAAIRSDLDRKSAECTELQKQFVRNLKSSQNGMKLKKKKKR